MLHCQLSVQYEENTERTETGRIDCGYNVQRSLAYCVIQSRLEKKALEVLLFHRYVGLSNRCTWVDSWYVVRTPCLSATFCMILTHVDSTPCFRNGIKWQATSRLSSEKPLDGIETVHMHSSTQCRNQMFQLQTVLVCVIHCLCVCQSVHPSSVHLPAFHSVSIFLIECMNAVCLFCCSIDTYLQTDGEGPVSSVYTVRRLQTASTTESNASQERVCNGSSHKFNLYWQT